VRFLYQLNSYKLLKKTVLHEVIYLSSGLKRRQCTWISPGTQHILIFVMVFLNLFGRKIGQDRILPSHSLLALNDIIALISFYGIPLQPKPGSKHKNLW